MVEMFGLSNLLGLSDESILAKAKNSTQVHFSPLFSTEGRKEYKVLKLCSFNEHKQLTAYNSLCYKGLKVA